MQCWRWQIIKHRLWIACLVLVAAYLGHPTVTQACSCRPLTSVAEISDGIFIGTFTWADGTNLNFKVEETLKGEVGDVIYVSGGDIGSSCYQRFKSKTRYLILANRTQSGWESGQCGSIEAYRVEGNWVSRDVLKMLRQRREEYEKD